MTADEIRNKYLAQVKKKAAHIRGCNFVRSHGISTLFLPYGGSGNNTTFRNKKK